MKLHISSTVLYLFFAVNLLSAQQTKFLYQSETLQIEQVSPNTFVHISYLSTQDFGKVACNGMIVINGDEALVIDTPADNETSLELITWMEKERKVVVKAVLATHFHVVCVGGLEEFHAHGVPSYGSLKTIALAKSAGFPEPENGFEDQLILEVGELRVTNQFLGEGHTRDKVVTYVPSDQVLFGGCLVKALGAGFGNLEDANTKAWSSTVSKVKSTFPDVRAVIPGHGKVGDVDLLDFTIKLFTDK